MSLAPNYSPGDHYCLAEEWIARATRLADYEQIDGDELDRCLRTATVHALLANVDPDKTWPLHTVDGSMTLTPTDDPHREGT